jgi:hypothetical protein
MMINKIKILGALLIIDILTISAVHAAFCSLRDPVSAIQMLYEDGYEYRSLVTTITEQDKQAVKEKLSFTIHQSEVNKHTLYLLYKNKKHVGFLQARSEWAKWGLVEIAWAINVDRSLKGFYFQRCRSPQCNDATKQYINSHIQNKNFEQLRILLSDDGESLSLEGNKTFTMAPELALLTLRSALKTLAITDISWNKDIEQITTNID